MSLQFNPECVRRTANWASIQKHHKFDKGSFDPIQTQKDISVFYPKIAQLLENIKK